jgi:septum site-determining protein MinC
MPGSRLARPWQHASIESNDPMSAVVCDTEPSACLELRSAALTLMAVVLKTADLDALTDELERRADAMPGLFDDEPVAVDLSLLREAGEVPDFGALVVLLCQHGMRPIAVRGGNAGQMAAARDAGLIEAPEGATRAALREIAPPQVIERVVEVQLAPLPPLVIDKPLRSGQQVYAQGRDLIVRALVSFGAEVSADGDIHVYAPLRGRAHAGAGGRRDARIYCHRLEAQMLAIAGLFCSCDDTLPEGLAGQAVVVRLQGDRLEIERLG